MERRRHGRQDSEHEEGGSTTTGCPRGKADTEVDAEQATKRLSLLVAASI